MHTSMHYGEIKLSALLMICILCMGSMAAAQVPDPRIMPPHAPPEAWRTRFPEITDLSKVHVCFSRSRCFGTCPAFTLEIKGNGDVRFFGEFAVAFAGAHTTRIPALQLRSLVDEFRAVNFFSISSTPLQSEIIVDASKSVISFDVDGHGSMIDGLAVHGPRASQLFAALDSIAAEWVTGNTHTVPDLLAEGVNIKAIGSAGWTILMDACEFGNAQVVEQLLRAGAAETINATSPVNDGKTALMFAARRGNRKMVQALLDAGADPHARDASGKSILDYARASGSDAVTRQILAAS